MESMALRDIFVGTMAGAAVVLFGAFYALFFALGRLHESRAMAATANLSYIALAVAVYLLAEAFALSGFWTIVAAVMLVGYFVAPRAIWQLCVGTHGDEPTELRTTR